MKAAVTTQYGPPEVLSIQDVPEPKLIEGDEERVLVQVHSSSVNPYDYLSRSGYWPVRLVEGLLKPKITILGIDLAGVVIETGEKVDRFKVGDQVFGNIVHSHAEIVRGRQALLALKPENVSFDEAAAVPTAGLTALQGLRDVGKLQAGQKVLIYGASGGIGHLAVQLAKHYGAEVTAVCSTGNQEWVKALGADHMIDYTQEDFTQNGVKYDLILDAVGKRTYYSCKPSLTETGIYITEHPLTPRYQVLQLLLSFIRGDKRVRTHLAKATAEDMDLLRDLLAAGTLKPVIEKRFKLEEIVAAHRHVEGRHTKGKAVIQVRTG